MNIALFYNFILFTNNLSPEEISSRCRQYGVNASDCSNSTYLPKPEYDNFLRSFNMPIQKDPECDKQKCYFVMNENLPQILVNSKGIPNPNCNDEKNVKINYKPLKSAAKIKNTQNDQKFNFIDQKVNSVEQTNTDTTNISNDQKNTSVSENIVTVIRPIYSTITVNEPITLYREVTTTITSEMPIINYKVTTITEKVPVTKLKTCISTETTTSSTTTTESIFTTLLQTLTETKTTSFTETHTTSFTTTKVLTESFLSTYTNTITNSYTTTTTTEKVLSSILQTTVTEKETNTFTTTSSTSPTTITSTPVSSQTEPSTISQTKESSSTIKNDLPFNQEKIEEAIKSIISPSLLKSLIKEIKYQPSEQIETIVKTTTQPIKVTETFSKIKTLTKTKTKTQNISNQQNQTIINTIYKYTQPKKDKCIDIPVNKKENCVNTPSKEEETSTVYVFKDDKDCVTNS